MLLLLLLLSFKVQKIYFCARDYFCIGSLLFVVAVDFMLFYLKLTMTMTIRIHVRLHCLPNWRKR